MKFYAITENTYPMPGANQVEAHEFDTEAEAKAFDLGVSFCVCLGDDGIRARGVYPENTVDEAIRKFSPKHEGNECAECRKPIESEDDGTSSPHGSMHLACAAKHEAEHPDQW